MMALGPAAASSLFTAWKISKAVPVSAHLFVPGFVYSNMIAYHIPEKLATAWTTEQTVAYLIECLDADEFCILCPDNDVTRERDAARIAWAVGDMIENCPALSR